MQGQIFADSYRHCAMREGGGDGHFWCGKGHRTNLFALVLQLLVLFVIFIKQRGGRRYIDGKRYMRVRTTGRGTSEREPDGGPEYLTRYGPELRCCTYIPGWISVSKVVGEYALDCVYKPTVLLWLDRQASWIRIRAIHTLFLLDFIDSFAIPTFTHLSVRPLSTSSS